MPVKVKMTTPKSELKAYITKGFEEQRKRVIRTLMYIGEQCVNEARLKGSYKDHTRNLRGSTGYVVVDNGQIVSLGAPSNGSSEGANKATAYMKQLSDGYPSGIVLIVVAGMHYAAYVADKGYDVLDSAEMLAEKLIGDLKTQLL